MIQLTGLEKWRAMNGNIDGAVALILKRIPGVLPEDAELATRAYHIEARAEAHREAAVDAALEEALRSDLPGSG